MESLLHSVMALVVNVERDCILRQAFCYYAELLVLVDFVGFWFVWVRCCLEVAVVVSYFS